MSSTTTTAQATSSTKFDNSVTASIPTTSTSVGTSSIKPCCACPETKKKRDLCIFVTGEEVKCRDLIEAHKACMRSLGFNI